MYTDKKKELLTMLASKDRKKFYSKYYVIETFVGTVEKEIDIFSSDNDGEEERSGEYNYEIYEQETGTIVYDGYFMDEEELMSELREELELVMYKQREEL